MVKHEPKMSKINTVHDEGKEDNNHIDSILLTNNKITTETKTSNQIPTTQIKKEINKKIFVFRY